MMRDEGIFEVSITTDEDVILARQKARELCREMGFSLLDQTRLVTAVSELARNIVVHAGVGNVKIAYVSAGEKSGIRIVFHDGGPGIPDIGRAMTDGYSTVNSMGLGLSGARRLVDDFEISSTAASGTTVSIVKWR